MAAGKSIPDADVHPTATGPAIKLVNAHQKPAPHILYAGWFCPFVQRSWIVLEAKKLEYQYKEINPYHKTSEFLALNPRGLVPTLACPVPGGTEGEDGVERKPLIESNIISEYLDGLDSTVRPLYSEDPFARAREKIWCDHVGTRIIPAFHRLLQHTAEKPYSIDDAKLELRNHLRTWIAQADDNGPFWAGNRLGMVDITLIPWAVRLWVFDHFKGVTDLIPSSGEDREIWERWRQWANAIESVDSVKNTLSDKEHYLPIYQRYADDQAQSELAKATRQGRGVP